MAANTVDMVVACTTTMLRRSLPSSAFIATRSQLFRCDPRFMCQTAQPNELHDENLYSTAQSPRMMCRFKQKLQ